MTDLQPAQAATPKGKRNNKRERLVAAACQLFYEQGVERTTLADIAAAADVLLGNVYYYFKTKDEMVKAAVDAQVKDIEEGVAALEQHQTPTARLKFMVKQLAANPDQIALYGCANGSLCAELGKRPNGSDMASGRLIQTSIAWVEKQFAAMGRDDARDLAVEMMTRYQGTCVVAQALGDPSLVEKEASRLERWIDSTAASVSASARG
jgi:AcrR family transcriptional regulator